MDENAIFTKVQKYLENVPVILIGTGVTIPLGIPGMGKLATHLINNVNDKFNKDANWKTIKNKLSTGIDLESSLTDVNLSDDLVNEIVLKTWELITESDINVFNEYILGKKSIPLSELISKYNLVHPKCVNVITTNYDRVVEYACDQKQIKYDTKYQGGYIQHLSNVPLKKEGIVNILKVHGSLDLFKDTSNWVFLVHGLSKTIPVGFSPEIISPGISKYKAVLTSSCRNILHESDEVIRNAKSFLCLGYGFNDEQIQSGIITQIRNGTPIVVATMALSSKAQNLLSNNSNNFVIIEKNPCKDDASRFTFKENQYSIDGNYWSIDGLLKII